MAILAYGELPFGGRNCEIAALTAEPSTYGSNVVFPRLEIFELTEEEDSTEMNAGDVQVAVHTFSTRLSGTLQGGGINLDALAILNGGDVATTGMTGVDLKTTFSREDDQVKGYFKITGQLYADDAGDDHIIAYKVKASSGPTFGSNQGEFLSTNVTLAGVFTGASPGKLYDIVAHEAVTAIA